MLASITIHQLQEWRAYADLEPFDEVRADFRAASIVWALLNVHRGKGKPQVKLKDCLLTFAPAAQRSVEQARSEIRQTMDFLMAMQGTAPKKAPKRGGK